MSVNDCNSGWCTDKKGEREEKGNVVDGSVVNSEESSSLVIVSFSETLEWLLYSVTSLCSLYIEFHRTSS